HRLWPLLNDCGVNFTGIFALLIKFAVIFEISSNDIGFAIPCDHLNNNGFLHGAVSSVNSTHLFNKEKEHSSGSFDSFTTTNQDDHALNAFLPSDLHSFGLRSLTLNKFFSQTICSR